jgi:hypothetical protein
MDRLSGQWQIGRNGLLHHKVSARHLLLLTMPLVIILFSLGAFSEDTNLLVNQAPTIFDVRRNLPMEPGEPVYRDFYINCGPESGLKKGQLVTAFRQIPIHNPVINQQQAVLNVTVGLLRIIQVERGITVARMVSELTDEQRATLEFEGLMIGDRIDLASASSEDPSQKQQRKRVGTEPLPSAIPPRPPEVSI